MIPNPTPITTTFNGMWIQNARLIFPQGRVDARIVPYDGSAHLLATGTKDVRGKTLAPELVATVEVKLKGLADTDREIRMVNVSAHDPAKPVSITVMFTEGRPHFIKDAFALAASDAAFAAVFNEAMVAIAEV